MQDDKRKHVFSRAGALLLLAVLLSMICAASAFAQSPYGSMMSVEKKVPAWAKRLEGTEITGEVQSVLSYKDDLILVLVEWPVSIRITDDTEFSSKADRLITKRTAKQMLVGRPVTITRTISEEGDVLASRIVMHDEVMLKAIQEQRPERMAKTTNPIKDAVPARGEAKMPEKAKMTEKAPEK